MDKEKICKIINSMLSQYIEKKLPPEQYFFVQRHLEKCPSCRKKYENLKELVKKIKYEYVFNLKKNASSNFEEKEYRNFKNNLNAYLDNELSYEDSIKFKKYIMKSPNARKEVQEVYQIQKLLRESFIRTKYQYCPDFTKNILNNFNKNFRDIKIAIATKSILVILLIFISIGGMFMIYKLAKHVFYEKNISPQKIVQIVINSNNLIV